MRQAGFALLILAACGNHHTGTGSAAYDSIEVDPPLAMLTIPLGGSATQDYQVFGIDGTHKTDITANCTLQVDATFGAFSAATLTALARGGKTPVTASCDDLTGNAELIVNLTGTVVTGTGTPANAPDPFGMATTATHATRPAPV